MSIAESNASVEGKELTPEEAAVAFDRIARRALDLSGEGFLAALDEGAFDDVDPDARPGLLDVLMALPLVRRRLVPGASPYQAVEVDCARRGLGVHPLVSTPRPHPPA
jgi:hypothetical protein